MMLIAVDIGNSSINMGFFADSGIFVCKFDTHPQLKGAGYVSLIDDFMRRNHLSKNDINCIISSVVSSHTPVFSDVLKRISGKSEVLVVNHKIDCGLRLMINRPEELGPDRIASVAAAYDLYKEPVAVADFGTATTVSVVGRDAEFIGGAILPGLKLMTEALEAGTSSLRKVPVEPPETALGKDTSGCIMSGLFYGTAGAIERIIKEVEKEAGLSLRLIITGGYSSLMHNYIDRPHEMRPEIVLEGLRVIHERNRPS